MRIAIVLPRFGHKVVGGAEKLAQGLALTAATAGWQVEVWTTCASSYASWANEFAAGHEKLDGVLVRRFPVDPWDPAAYEALSKKVAQHVILPTADQYAWLESGPQSTPLFEHVASHAEAFDAVFVLPYLHSLAYYAAWLAGERAIMWPCLHDEIFAYMEPFRLLLESVYGVVFLSPEEATLARRRLHILPRRSAVLGSGVSLATAAYPSAERGGSALLYVGRLEGGKNVATLYDYVRRYHQEGSALTLVVAGDGPLQPPATEVFDFRGFVSERDKRGLYATSLAVCQPSYNESFSLVMMEAWLAARPALVWSGCAVTRGHVARSRGGLWFASYGEFRGAIDWLKAHPSAAQQMGANGRAYVEANYTWPTVFRRLARTLQAWGVGSGEGVHG